MNEFQEYFEGQLKEFDREVQEFTPGDPANDQNVAAILASLDGASRTQKIAALTGALVHISIVEKDPIATTLVTSALTTTLGLIFDTIAQAAGEKIGVEPEKLAYVFKAGAAQKLLGE